MVVVPLDQAGGLVSSVRLGSVRNMLLLQLPGKARPTRLDISIHSRIDLESLLAKLPGTTERPVPVR